MKRLLTLFIFVIIILAFFSPTLAIEQTPKETKAEKKEEPVENPALRLAQGGEQSRTAEGGADSQEYEKTEIREGKTEGTVLSENKDEKTKQETKEGKTKGTISEKLTKWLKSLEKQKAEEKYDYFIDKNNNGIDDRQERKSKETTSPPTIRPKPKEEQPTKPAPSIKKTGEKEKNREAPKEKEGNDSAPKKRRK